MKKDKKTLYWIIGLFIFFIWVVFGWVDLVWGQTYNYSDWMKG
jgi:hypothetical protein